LAVQGLSFLADSLKLFGEGNILLLRAFAVFVENGNVRLQQVETMCQIENLTICIRIILLKLFDSLDKNRIVIFQGNIFVVYSFVLISYFLVGRSHLLKRAFVRIVERGDVVDEGEEVLDVEEQLAEALVNVVIQAG